MDKEKSVLVVGVCTVTAVICLLVVQGQWLIQLVRSAEQGNRKAAFELATAYHVGGCLAGRRVCKNDALAIKYAAHAGRKGRSILAKYIDIQKGHKPEDIMRNQHVRTISTALAEYTRDPLSRYLLGTAYYRYVPSQRQKGMRLLKEGVDLRGTQCMFVYAQALRDQGDFNAAQAFFKKLPRTPSQRFHLGLTYFKQGDHERGLTLIKRAAARGYIPAKNFLRIHQKKTEKQAVLKSSRVSKETGKNGSVSIASAQPPMTFNVAPTGIGNTSHITLNVSPSLFGDQSGQSRTSDLDVLLELKVAYFLSTDTEFKNTYGKGGLLWGPELTVKLHKRLFGWISVDFFSKEGTSLRNDISSCAGVSTCCQILTHKCNNTHLTFIPLAIGLKYFVPFSTARRSLTGDFYFGLGVQPTYLSSSVSRCSKRTAVGVGGIAKVGAYLEASQSLFVDLFVDYSFVSVDDNEPRTPRHCATNLSGFIFGAGIGYRFN